MIYKKSYARNMSEDDFQLESASCGSGFGFDDPMSILTKLIIISLLIVAEYMIFILLGTVNQDM